MALTGTRPRLPSAPAFGRASRRRRRERNRRTVDLAAAAFGLGLGSTLGLAITEETRRALAAPGGLSIAIGRVAGLSGAYLMLMMVLLMARIPALERAVGQDRLTRWHRRIGGWPVILITVHVVFITLGYAQSASVGFLHQMWTFLDSYPDVLAASVAFALLVMVSVVSVGIVRRRLRYETWWAVHLYVYLALALAFAHQIVTGAAFVAHPVQRLIWAAGWAGTAGVVIVYRVGLPVWRTLRHQLRVVEIRDEGPDVISIVCAGRHLEQLKVVGGQFFQWRFLTKGLWWQAHPYSLSALPSPPYVRLTLRARGDHGQSLAAVKPGTFVAIEGPYGAFTSEHRHSEQVLLVGAGVGITPLRAILEDLPAHVDVTVIVRASRHADLVLRGELIALLGEREGRLYEVVGSRDTVSFDVRMVRKLVPDVSMRDVYVCGPDGFALGFVSAVRRLGVPDERIHRESFAF